MPLVNTRRASAYSKLDKEDPEELSHRRALFLIYKAMEQADSVTRSRPSCFFLRTRIRRVRVRIGKRLKKLRKGVSSLVSCARFRAHENKDIVMEAKAAWIRIFGSKDVKIAAIPPLLK